MSSAVKALCWGALVAVLAVLFYSFAPAEDKAADERTSFVLLMEDGPRTVTMAEYLPLALAAEMPVDFGPEALKAQAVAIRTYVLASRRHGEANVCTDSGCCLAFAAGSSLRERWGGDYRENWRAVAAAAAATDGEYLAYGGQAIQAVFHASSAGTTESSAALWSAVPYLVSVASPERAQDVPGLITTVTVTAEAFAETLGLSLTGDPAGWVESTALEDSGRVREVMVAGQRFSGAEMRSRFGLRSTDFTLAWGGGAFQFTVAGNGHGIGMSQYGAKTYAARGWTYERILSHYYPGTVLTELSF